ncbi:MAG: hypothetical protein ACNA8W_24225 [Bradymonadaceae bacterium]
MGLIQCQDCGQQVSDRAPACPHCGWSPQGEIPEWQPTSKMAWTKPGEFISKYRIPHFIGVAAYGGLGLFTIIDEDWSGIVSLAGVLIAIYLLTLLTGRALSMRSANHEVRRATLFDFLDILLISLAMTFISGFWMGFANEAFSRHSDVPGVYLRMGMTFSGIATFAFLILVASGISTIADRTESPR